MQILRISKSFEGCKSNDSFICVFDCKGKIFYIIKNDKQKYFNLPKGDYFTNNEITITKPFIHKIPSLPKFEVKRPNVNDFDISFGNNPYKATVDFNKETILVDYALLKLPFFCLVWIIYHEKGHQFYKSEFKCDLYATRQMLLKGYNYSQVKLAPLLTLSELSIERMIENFENVCKLEN